MGRIIIDTSDDSKWDGTLNCYKQTHGILNLGLPITPAAVRAQLMYPTDQSANFAQCHILSTWADNTYVYVTTDLPVRDETNTLNVDGSKIIVDYDVF